MIKTVIDFDIMKPRDEVFAYISNFENNPAWQKGKQVCTLTSEGPVGVGTTYEQMTSFWGRPIVTTFEVVEYGPNRHVKFVSRQCTFPLHIFRSVEPIEGGTHVHVVIDGEPTGWFLFIGPLVDRLIARAFMKDYMQLKTCFISAKK